jgi:hypothetical protein
MFRRQVSVRHLDDEMVRWMVAVDDMLAEMDEKHLATAELLNRILRRLEALECHAEPSGEAGVG